jgi:hypothetical protein
MAIININIANIRPYKICPNWDFWFENKPSGNPGLHTLSHVVLSSQGEIFLQHSGNI